MSDGLEKNLSIYRANIYSLLINTQASLGFLQCCWMICCVVTEQKQ